MQAREMDKNWWENFLVKALILIVSSSGVTAMLSKEPYSVVLKNCIAGLFAGVVGFIICTTGSVSQTYTLIICMFLSAFVSSLWPVLGDYARKKLKKKADDDIQNN